MPVKIKSTLTEVQIKLSEILFQVLQELEPEGWQSQSQVVYSGVDDWDTAYNAYLVANKIEEVKFPFCTITRDETQESFTKQNAPLTVVNRSASPGAYEVQGAVIRPVQLKFNWTIYRRDHLLMEDLIDILLISGSETSEYKFYSEVLKQDSEFSFYLDEPTHKMIPDKQERLKGRGHIFAVTVPITVDCILGVPTEKKLIGEIIQRILLLGTEEVLCEDTIQDPDYPLNP